MKSYTFALVGALTAAALSVNALEDSLLGHGAMRRHHDRANNQSLEKRAYSGHATYYNTETGNAGSCGDMLSNGAFTVAVTGTLMNSGLCGKTVTISANGKTTTARIVDTCPPGGGNCGGPDLDLSPALFQFFNPLGVGKFSINWSIGGGGGGGSSGGSSNGGGNNNNNNNNNNNDAEEKAAAAAAARKKAAEEKAQAIQDKKDAAAASSASVSAAARASSVSEVRASRASVASESRASVAEEKSASRASASAEAKASAEVVAQLKEEERTRPKNIEQFADVVNGITNMVKQAKEA